MKKYLQPEIKFETFETVDIMAASFGNNHPTTKSVDPYEVDKF